MVPEREYSPFFVGNDGFLDKTGRFLDVNRNVSAICIVHSDQLAIDTSRSASGTADHQHVWVAYKRD